MADAPSPIAWHALPAEAVLDRLRSRRDGLDEQEAERRHREQGPNRLSAGEGWSAWRRLLAQFANALVVVLIVAAAVMALIGHLADAAVVGAVVVINALIGFVQEGRAERALDAVRRAVAPQAHVIRDNKERQIAAARLVTGDVVTLGSGDMVPADLRVIEAKGLEAQEAALTGESATVAKSAAAVAGDTPLAERSSMLFSGTVIARGRGRGVVVAIGDATEIGRIGRLLAAADTSDTPLAAQLRRFSHRLTCAIIALALATFAIGYWLQAFAASEMFQAAVGLAIAAVPEALPAILTITMAVGVNRMARRKAIVRRLPAVETLGAVDVICADKTGTLTLNELTVRSAMTASGRFSVEGAGYAPEGAIRREGSGADGAADDPLLRALARGATLCNDATLRKADGEWRIEGDLTDGALIVFAAKAGQDPETVRRTATRIDAVPYEADLRYMATLDAVDGARIVHVKGAPERILELCDSVATENGTAPFDRAAWLDAVDRMAGEGQRVLAVACKTQDGDRLDVQTVERGGFTLLGLCGMIDPARPEAADSIATCRRAGIEVKMITGDHAATAGAVGASIGLKGKTIAGSALDRLDEAGLAAAARDHTVFARATPEHKVRLIRALRAENRTIAMTGDGFNDAPALRDADVGVAMGQKGTDAARQAADMVLTDDNFATIVHAVEEGRTVYDNIRKAVIYILPTSFGEAAVIILAVMLGQTLPITALQVLWINLITEVTLSVAIAFDPAEPGIMERRPRPRSTPLLSRFLAWRIGFVALLMMTGCWLLFVHHAAAGPVETARTVVVNALVAFEIGYLFNCRRLRDSSLSLAALLGNRVVLLSVGGVIALQLLFTYAPFMQRLFGSAPLGPAEWALTAVAGAALFAIVEIEKRLTRGRMPES